jgi:putative spermidine/putrescine transport system permease protein
MGASFPAVMLKVILPNMRSSMIASAALTTALVLGEFAFASLLLKSTLPTEMVTFERSDPRGGLALALFVMVFTAVILGLVVRAMRRRGLTFHASGV